MGLTHQCMEMVGVARVWSGWPLFSVCAVLLRCSFGSVLQCTHTVTDIIAMLLSQVGVLPAMAT